MLTFAVLSGLYYLAWRVCRGRIAGEAERRAAWRALTAGLVIVNLSMLWLYPIGAADVFDNIARGRITAQHGGNPFYDTPADYRRDPFRAYVAWPRSTSAYGPVWEWLAAGASRMAGDNVLANVLVFKTLGLIFYIGGIVLIARILHRHAPERALQGVCLFAWNPLLIYATAGNAHNDIAMVFLVLLAIDTLSRRRFTLAATWLAAGALIKFIPILLLPVVIAAGLRAIPTPRRRIRLLLNTGLACATLVIAAFAPFWRGGDPLNLERRSQLFTSSLAAVAQAQLEAPLGREASQRLISTAALVLTGLIVLDQARRVWSQPSPGKNESSWLVPIRAATVILLFYLLVTCLWFQPWYAIWPLALAALLPEGALARTAVLLSYAALWKAIIFNLFLFPGGKLPPRTWRETLLGPATLGLVWLYAGYALVAHRRSRIAMRRWRARPIRTRQSDMAHS
ncbi:MAG TPA: hypothetical protein VJ754_07255 [Anaerolineae bacterium]|nr:hypothetical protein [Anaerolineae bacterium]